jgi:ribonuclease-3
MWVDYKTQLQEMTQFLFKELPEYTLLRVEGPPHQPSFIVQVSINSEIFAQATGRSKKEAEQSAAMIACKRVREENPQLDSSFL